LKGTLPTNNWRNLWGGWEEMALIVKESIHLPPTPIKVGSVVNPYIMDVMNDPPIPLLINNFITTIPTQPNL